MAYDVFPDIDFDLAIQYREQWKTLITASEGEVEQRVAKTTRPIRGWSISCELESDADSVKDFLSARRGRYGNFLFRTRDKRSWPLVYIGVGNGSNTFFCANFLDYTTLKIYDNGTLKTITTHYSVAATGPQGTAKITFVTPPASGRVIEAGVASGRLVPLVRMLNDYYEDTYVAQDHYAFKLQLVETKEDIVP